MNCLISRSIYKFFSHHRRRVIINVKNCYCYQQVAHKSRTWDFCNAWPLAQLITLSVGKRGKWIFIIIVTSSTGWLGILWLLIYHKMSEWSARKEFVFYLSWWMSCRSIIFLSPSWTTVNHDFFTCYISANRIVNELLHKGRRDEPSFVLGYCYCTLLQNTHNIKGFLVFLIKGIRAWKSSLYMLCNRNLKWCKER